MTIKEVVSARRINSTVRQALAATVIWMNRHDSRKQLSLLRLFETAKKTKVCPNILFADVKRRQRRNKQLTRRASSNDPSQGIDARELQKGCYCRSVSASHKGSPLILEFKAAFKQWITLFGRRELHVLKYWSPDAQLEGVKQRLRHLVAARYNADILKWNCWSRVEE